MKYFGWIVFFLIVIALGLGGYFIVKDMSFLPFKYKDVEEINYTAKLNINDFISSKLSCNNDKCTYKKKDFKYKFKEIKRLGKQDITLDINYDGEEYNKVFKNVNVIDKESPKIELKELDIVLSLNENFNAKSYIKEVTDNYSKLSISDIEIENKVNHKKAGDYEVIYQVLDNSGNIGKAKLNVSVIGSGTSKKSTTNNNKNDTKKSEKVSKKSTPEKSTTTSNKITLKYDSGTNNSGNGSPSDNYTLKLSTSGIYTMSHTFNNKSKTHSITDTVLFKNYTEKMHIDGELTGSGNFQVDIVYKIDGHEEKYNDKINGYNFSVNATLLPTDAVLTIKVKDIKLNIEYKETINIKFKAPSYLSDAIIFNKAENGTESIYYDVLGDIDNYEIEYYISESNDPRVSEDTDLDEILIDNDNYLTLKYREGYYYVVNVDFFCRGATISKSIKIKK